MEMDEPLQRLKGLQRDLISLADKQVANVDRLSAELEASIGDLRRLFDKRKKSEESRRKLAPVNGPGADTITIDEVEYKVNEDFRQAALRVADELDVNELDAAKLCVDAGPTDLSLTDTSLPFRAVLRFQETRQTLLNCLRLLLQQSDDLDEEDEEGTSTVRSAVEQVVSRNQDGQPQSSSTYWRRCIEGLGEIESSLKKIGDHKQTMLMTGQGLGGEIAEALEAQRLLLLQQHETLAAAMSYLVRASRVKPEDFRAFLSKAAALEATSDVSMHYLPIIMTGSTYFGSGDATMPEAAHDLHRLFAAGPGQLQWKQRELKAAATVCWLAEYSARFADTHADPALRVADRQKAEEDRSKLFFDSVRDRALHTLLAACIYLRPEVWHDPAKVGLVRFLLADSPSVSIDAPPASDDFAALTMRELQLFTDAFVSNMPDVLRRLKLDEDGRRREWLARSDSVQPHYEPDLERFIVIMSYAYHDDAEGAHDFWHDKESNLYGFLRWVSQRLPTPRVAAFCELLRSIAAAPKNADHAHRFLLEDTAVVSGKLRKTYNVSWAQIFAELETYAMSLKERVASAQPSSQEGGATSFEIMEPETPIMLEAYLRLAAHICRVSPAARQWLLREQTFHMGEVMIQLASSATLERIQASCFDMLSAMLTDKVQEINDGMWAMLDNWLTGGASPSSGVAKSQPAGRSLMSKKHYLARFMSNPETATALVNLLTSLMTPSASQAEATLDALPFPENLGSPHRNAGIENYVDFAMQAFRTWSSPSSGIDGAQVDVLRCACLEFVCTCLSIFNEDLVLLANATNLAVDSAIRTSSLAAYARLHPFARVMEWLFNNGVIIELMSTAHREVDELNVMHPHSPAVSATLASVRAMNLAMKLQATYFDIVRPIVKTQASQRSPPVANAALASFDDVLLSHLPIVADIASFAASRHLDLSLEAINLLRKLASSRKLSESNGAVPRQTPVGNRLIGAIADSSDAIAIELIPDFQIFEWDIEAVQPSGKLIKAKAILDMLLSSLSASMYRPSLAHVLLGFACHERTVGVAADSSFGRGTSLYHAILACAADAPIAVRPTNLSWLLNVKRGCLEVLLKLALSPLTSAIVRPDLRYMEFLAASSKNQILATEMPMWDMKTIVDSDILLDDSALAVRDFLRVRELFFHYAALELRSAADAHMYSVQEKAVSALLGVIRFPNGEQEPTLSVFDLFDFFDLETVPASEVANRYLTDLDLSVCIKDDPQTVTAYDLGTAEQLLILRKRELVLAGRLRDAAEDQQVEDEIGATLASLRSWNSWRAIQVARIEALEAWTDLLALMVLCGGLEAKGLSMLALQGLQIALPKFERALNDNLDSAALLAKLTVTLIPAAIVAEQTPQNASAAIERLISAFRICLKAITDGGADLALRDVCYRICCSVVSAVPLTAINGRQTPSPQAKQLLQLIQAAGERLMTVATEDSFSGRGVTRVSALLFLSDLLSLFKAANSTVLMLRALAKLNFMPVLIDTGIASVASSFSAANQDELSTTLAYFHTSLALILRLCDSAEGSQLVLSSGFFDSVNDSRLFSTDPDIGLDIDNPVALREFYRLLAAVLRVITSIVVTRGPTNEATKQRGKAFLQENRFSMQAVFKRTSAVQKTAGPPETEAMEVADEFARLIYVTGFLDVSYYCLMPY